MKKLSERVVLVTGASRGIGAAIARALAAEGARLGLASRSGDDLGLANAVALPCDVRRPEQVEALVAATVTRFGAPDALVVNAGVGAYGAFEDVSAEHVEEMIDVNVKGTIYAVRAALPHLLASAPADIVTIASDAGRHGAELEAVYSASKFAQIGLTRSLDQELRPRGVRCTTICPGGVATDFAMGEGRGRTPDMPDLADMMSADDVAATALFALTRPPNLRVLDIALLPMSDPSCV
jgi:NAD(P)-dependent dehydrogenase (short-subunit alcohol dehydrogenase family)